MLSLCSLCSLLVAFWEGRTCVTSVVAAGLEERAFSSELNLLNEAQLMETGEAAQARLPRLPGLRSGGKGLLLLPAETQV